MSSHVLSAQTGVADIGPLAVSASHQGRGLGSRILSQLEGLDRLDVTFSSAFTAEKETDRPVARLIHLIWLGSPLASKFLPGIRSFVTLNPGEWADTFGPELN